MSALPAQQYLLRHIRQQLPESVSLADMIADILFVSSDSAYRRIRCETPLTLDETHVLCKRFNISMDRLLDLNSSSVLFQNHRLDHRNYTFEMFLAGLQQQLDFINSCPDREVMYLTKDVPLFHSFYFRPLFAFRYFFWMKSIVLHPDFSKVSFSFDCLPEHIYNDGLQLCRSYCHIPSLEIWNTEAVNSLIAQVEFYYEAGYIKSAAEVNAILDAVADTLEHLKTQAEAGAKFSPGEKPLLKPVNFQLFHNTTVLGDNTIMVRCGNTRTVFLNYDVLNYMYTADEAFCADIDDMLRGLMRRSTLISVENEKQRFRFFNILADKINARKKQL